MHRTLIAFRDPFEACQAAALIEKREMVFATGVESCHLLSLVQIVFVFESGVEKPEVSIMRVPNLEDAWGFLFQDFLNDSILWVDEILHQCVHARLRCAVDRTPFPHINVDDMFKVKVVQDYVPQTCCCCACLTRTNQY